ncbi:hypothetical protein Stsp01_12720 [Streptomyces sp. NBRC 13847]|nr:hypothetical protein Stsp01_12720 [Streptomyces sp. NBRC 13847]
MTPQSNSRGAAVDAGAASKQCFTPPVLAARQRQGGRPGNRAAGPDKHVDGHDRDVYPNV